VRHFVLLLSPVLPSHSHPALRADGVDQRLHAGSHRADGRAPARGGPALAGVPWACKRELGEGSHAIRLYVDS
jgi:hypothetical protein